MARRMLPAVLAFAALVADLTARHELALVILLASIPAAFALALECYGDALEARCGGTRPLLALISLVLLLVSAMLRSPALVGGVPHVAVSALGLSVLLYGALAVGAVVPSVRTRPAERIPTAAELPLS
jgi:hypothetical protein